MPNYPVTSEYSIDAGGVSRPDGSGVQEHGRANPEGRRPSLAPELQEGEEAHYSSQKRYRPQLPVQRPGRCCSE